jgi:adenylosuccinate lyase
MENITLWHERDISHSSAERVILPDATLVLDYSLATFTRIMKGLQIFPKQMKRNIELTKGLIFSQRVMLALIDKGLTRQTAYELVQRNSTKAWQGNKNFLNLLKADPDIAAKLTTEELESLFDVNYYLRYVDDIFQRLGLTEIQWKEALNRVRTPADT